MKEPSIQSCVIAKVRLKHDPLDENHEPSRGEMLAFQAVTKARITKLLRKGWVQFSFVKKTTGIETSVIATLNRNLYTYTRKGGTAPKKRGLMRFVVYNRKGTIGVWRSAYSMRVFKISEENKNQAGRTASGRVREGKNRKVNVDTNTSSIINWNYETGRPS